MARPHIPTRVTVKSATAACPLPAQIGVMQPSELSLLKGEWEEAERAARHAADVAARAVSRPPSGAGELPPELDATVKELQALATEKKQAYFQALAGELLCAQTEERRRRE